MAIESNVKKARSIEEILDRVRSYDRVITLDPALADALELRIDRPVLGGFASTPRGLVYDQEVESDLRDRRELFLEINRRTELGWKEIVFYLREVLDAWQETGNLSDLQEFDRFNTDEARTVIDHLGRINSVFLGMQNYQPEFDGDVAVVAPGQFSGLDRNVLPPDHLFDSISVLSENDTFSLPTFQIVPSTGSLIHSVASNITEENCMDVAVVVDPESPYQPLLESELRRKGVDFMPDQKTLTRDDDYRTVLNLIRAAFTRNRLINRDVLPILNRLGKRIPLRDHNRILKYYDSEKMKPIRELLEKIPRMSFRQVLDHYHELTGEHLDQLREVLGDLNFLDRTVSRERLENFTFYLSTFDPTVEESDRGVLLASPLSTGYLDRPIVFYLGMNSTWTRPVSDLPWVDRERRRDTNLSNFQVMLQQGHQQYYLVQEKQGIDRVTPCFYFNVLLEGSFETFSDCESIKRNDTSSSSTKSGFDKTELEMTPTTVDCISQSSLNQLAKSPRNYMFDKIVPTTENVYMRKGKVFHDFAEFYVNHADFVEEQGLEPFVPRMKESVQDFMPDWDTDVLETELRAGMRVITNYLKAEGFESFQPHGYESGPQSSDNILADRFEDRPIKEPICEAWFENHDLGARGRVDLIRREDHLIDYKSGRKPSEKEIIRKCIPDTDEDNPNFQAILYLAHHRRQYPDRKLQFTFFHFLENVSEVFTDDFDVNDYLVTVTYYPSKFADQVSSNDTFDYLKSSSKERRKVLEGLTYPRYRSFFENHEFPDFDDKKEAQQSPLAVRFGEYCQEHFKDAKYVRKQAAKTIKKLIDFRQTNFFLGDLKQFEGFLQEQLERLNEYRRQEFPIENIVDELDLKDLEHRDLIVDDRGVDENND